MNKSAKTIHEYAKQPSYDKNNSYQIKYTSHKNVFAMFGLKIFANPVFLF